MTTTSSSQGVRGGEHSAIPPDGGGRLGNAGDVGHDESRPAGPEAGGSTQVTLALRAPPACASRISSRTSDLPVAGVTIRPSPMKTRALSVMLLPIPGVLYLLYAFAPAVWGPLQIAGLALSVPGLALLTLARIQLGNSFSVTPQATALVTSGLYSRIRNPVYVFGLTLFTGILLYTGYTRFLVLLVPVAVMQVIRAGRESKVLEAQFGDAYREYRARTWF